MDNYILPGALLKSVNVLELNIGDKVYDKASNREGVISDIKETVPEWIEAYVKLTGDKEETPAWKLPGLVYLG